MARYKVVPVGEASLHTLLNGQEIELKLPEGGAYTPMMKLLAACMLRAEEDLGWWEEMVAWAEREQANSRAEVKRKQIRLVPSGPAAKLKNKNAAKPERPLAYLNEALERNRNATVAWLEGLGYADLATGIADGTITAVQAFDEAHKRRTT